MAYHCRRIDRSTQGQFLDAFVVINCLHNSEEVNCCSCLCCAFPPSFVSHRRSSSSKYDDFLHWFRCENPSTWNLITFTCKQKKKLNFLNAKGFLFPFREASKRLQVIYHLKFYRISNDLEAHICLHSQKHITAEVKQMGGGRKKVY